MNKFYFLIIFGALLTIPFLDDVFATTYDINMPTGSASPDAPYFWQNEKTGEPTGDIEISVGDTIIWKNGDQAKHTITSGTLEDGPDGIFGGANFLVPGEFYQFTFTEKGRYPYFCLIHPWMTGVVTVIDGYKIVPDVGKDIGDGLSSFNIDYQYSGIISGGKINEEQKSITFDVTSDPKSNDHNLMMMLPSELIEGPYVIFVDGQKNLRFEYVPDDDVNTIELELLEDSKEITIVGTKIVPEFGILSIVILGIAITNMIFISRSRISTIY
jgi:plastocyanin